MISARVMSLLEDWDFRECSNSNEKHNAFYEALARVVEAAEHAHFATDNRQEIVARIMLAESLTELELALKGVGV